MTNIIFFSWTQISALVTGDGECLKLGSGVESEDPEFSRLPQFYLCAFSLNTFPVGNEGAPSVTELHLNLVTHRRICLPPRIFPRFPTVKNLYCVLRDVQRLPNAVRDNINS